MGSDSTDSCRSFICAFPSLSWIFTADIAYARYGSNHAIYLGSDQTLDNRWSATGGKLELASLPSSIFIIYWVFNGEKIKERLKKDIKIYPAVNDGFKTT